MAIDLNSEDARLIRGFIPINTLPGFKFDELCASHDVFTIEDGEELFTQGSVDTDYYFLLAGSVFLEAGKTEVDTVNAGTEAARFALAHHIPRKVTCIAQDSVRYLKVDSEMFSQDTVSELLQRSDLLVDENDQVNEEIIPFLLKAPLFRQLFVSVLPSVSACLQEVKFEAGQTVIEQDQQNSKFYIIQDGSCQVTHRPFKNAKEIQLDDLQQSDAFGEYALLMNGTSDITVKTITDCVMYSLEENDFNQWIKQPLIAEIDWNDADQSGDVFLDIQKLEDYRKTHVKGSINFPFSSLRVRMGQLADSDTYIVVSNDEQLSMATVIMLRQQQLNAKILVAGLGAVPEGSLDHILMADADESSLADEESQNAASELHDAEELSAFQPVVIGSPIQDAEENINDQQSAEADQAVNEKFAGQDPQSVAIEAAKEIDSIYHSVMVAEGEAASLIEESSLDGTGIQIKKLESKLHEVWKAYKKTRGQLQKSKRKYSACYREYTRIEQSYHSLLAPQSEAPAEIRSEINPTVTADEINSRLREEFAQLTVTNKKLKLQINLLKQKLEESKGLPISEAYQSRLNDANGDKDALIENESLLLHIHELEQTVQQLEQKKISQQKKAKQYVAENSKLRQLIQELAKQTINEQSQDHVLSSFDLNTEFATSDHAYGVESQAISQLIDQLSEDRELKDEVDENITPDQANEVKGWRTKIWLSIISSTLLTALLVALLINTEKGQILLQQIGF